MPSRAASLKIASDGNLISHVIYRTNDGKKSEAVSAIKTLSTQLDFPILADYEDLFIYETITLLNPNQTPAIIEIIALDRNGYEIDRTIDRSFASWESNAIALIDIFGPETLKDLSTVRVISHTNIAGIQLVDYPGNDLVGLPALTTYSKGWLFPIATEGGNQALWTRVGIINPGRETADIHIEAFDASNNSLGVIDRKSLLPNALYFTATDNTSAEGGAIPLNTAYIKVTADRPISGFEVIGIVNGSGLSAVMGIPDEDHTTVGFEIRGTNDGDLLSIHSMVLMEDGSVKSTAGSLGSEEWNEEIYAVISKQKAQQILKSEIRTLSTKKKVYLVPSIEDERMACTCDWNWKRVCNGEREGYYQNIIAQKVKQKLSDSGYEVQIFEGNDCSGSTCNGNCPPKPGALCQGDIGEKAKNWGADVLVSFHTNAGPGGCSGSRADTITFWECENTDYVLAQKINEAVFTSLKPLRDAKGIINSGKKLERWWNTTERPCPKNTINNCEQFVPNVGCNYPDWYTANMPACLIESLFHDNPKESEILRSVDGQEAIAQGIANGIKEFFGDTPQCSSGTFKVGDCVRVTGTGNEGLCVREKPCRKDDCSKDTVCPKLCNATEGSTGKVVDGCVYADGYTWWKIQWDGGVCSGKIGWSAENYLEKITCPDNLPNLTPYKPSDWSDKIVVSKTTGTRIDSSPLYTTDTLYVDWAVINNGTGAVTDYFGIKLYVDGDERFAWPITNSLDPNQYIKILDYSIGSLSDGTHYIKIVADVTGAVQESNELDNEYTKTITVQSPAGVLSVTPSDGLASSGNQGGPFTPSGKSYTLQNTGGSSINWTASKGQAWVTLSSTSGTLGAGASTTVTVSINSNANSLTPGTYNDTISFTNTTNGNGNTTRPVSLTANATGGVLSVTPSDGLTSSGNQGGPFTPSGKSYTLQNTGGSSISWTASKGQGWVTLSPSSGTLGAGASTTVTVSINSNANSLTPNTYNDTVSFTNTTNGNGNTTRPVSLTVTYQPETVSTPSTPSGTTSGTVGTSYTYSTGGAISNLGHLVEYRFNWGDGTYSNWSSSSSAPKSWSSPGTYVVKAQARCATHTDKMSNESQELLVSIQTIVTTRILTIASSNPNSGVSITVSPNDNNDQGSGTTLFTRIYYTNTAVTLTAPSTAGGNSFQKWQRNGVDLTTSQTANVTMNADYTMTAVYATPTPIPTPTPSTVTPKISGGAYHSMTLKSDGSVWTWGSNEYTQLGDGTNTNRSNPIQVSGLSGVITIDGGGGHNLALKLDGTVWAWGGNWSGQLGDGTKINRSTPVQVTGLSSIAVIDAGDSHSLALKSDGAVYVWGRNNYGQLGDGSTMDRSTPVQMTGLSSVTTIAGGWGHSLALKSDGTVWAWGYNNHGQLGDGTTIDRNTPVQVSGLSGIIAIACGDDHSIALKSDGTVWAWGNNGNGALGDGTTTNRTSPVQMGGLSGITDIAGGSNHTIALKSDGTIWVCGDYDWVHSDGGVGFWYRTSPVQFTEISGIAAIAAGRHHLVALKPDGTVWTWGSNWHGELGDGTTIDRTTPAKVNINLGEMTIPPMVATSSASNITSNSATLNGTVNANGLNTTAWFEYGTTSGSYPNKSSIQDVSGSSDTAVSIGISGLLAGTSCYYRIAAQNSAGTRYGSEISFTTLTPPVIRTLTVASSNPNSGVSITVSPNDNNGQGNGTAQFTRTYNNNTAVTLTAPSTAGGNSFQKWQRNGADWTTSQTTNVTMNADYTMTAVYATTTPTPTPTATPITHDLTVTSSNPNSGVSITVSPNDNSGQGGGTTQFTRTYNTNTTVILTAPSTAGGNSFQKWQRNGADWTTSQTTNVTMNADYIMTAVYATTTPIPTPTSPPIARTLTVASSNPNSGVSITVSPNDISSQGGGTTQFTRTYNTNTTVILTAPSTAGGNSFQKWQRNGVDLTTSQTANVTMNTDYTMTAVFATTTPIPTPTSTPVATGNIAGQVSNSMTGAGINGATVTLATGETATTTTVQGQDGIYAIQNVAVGSNTLTVAGKGFETATQPITVVPGNPNPGTGANVFNVPLTSVEPTPCNAANLDAEPEPLRLKKEEGADETVTVTCENGFPVAGVAVTSTVQMGKQRIFVSPSSAVTDVNGQATFTVTATQKTGNAKVRFEAAGLRDTVKVKVVK